MSIRKLSGENLGSRKISGDLSVTGYVNTTSGIRNSSNTLILDTSGNAVSATTATTATNALKVRLGGTTGGTAVTVFVQAAASTPTANTTGDIWIAY